MTRDMTARASPVVRGPRPLSAYEEKLVAKERARARASRRGRCAPRRFRSRGARRAGSVSAEDLDSIDYAPHGMEDAVANLRNRKRNEEARSQRGRARAFRTDAVENGPSSLCRPPDRSLRPAEARLLAGSACPPRPDRPGSPDETRRAARSLRARGLKARVWIPFEFEGIVLTVPRRDFGVVRGVECGQP